MTNLKSANLLATAFIALAALAAPAVPASAKATLLPGQNRASMAAACDRSATCINWGGGVFTSGDTGVICNDKKCVKVEEDAPARESRNNNRGGDQSGGGGGSLK